MNVSRKYNCSLDFLLAWIIFLFPIVLGYHPEKSIILFEIFNFAKYVYY